jgi:hypothetical protein
MKSSGTGKGLKFRHKLAVKCVWASVFILPLFGELKGFVGVVWISLAVLSLVIIGIEKLFFRKSADITKARYYALTGILMIFVSTGISGGMSIVKEVIKQQDTQKQTDR